VRGLFGQGVNSPGGRSTMPPNWGAGGFGRLISFALMGSPVHQGL